MLWEASDAFLYKYDFTKLLGSVGLRMPIKSYERHTYKCVRSGGEKARETERGSRSWQTNTWSPKLQSLSLFRACVLFQSLSRDNKTISEHQTPHQTRASKEKIRPTSWTVFILTTAFKKTSDLQLIQISNSTNRGTAIFRFVKK